MNLSGPFIRRPIATSLLATGLLLAGAVAFRWLPVAALPQVEYPTIQVEANLPGCDPITVASAVSAPLERRLAQISGVSELTSMSSLGKCRISVQFDLDRDIDGAARDVQAAINGSLADLPTTLQTRPEYQKSNPADTPVMILALTSETLPPAVVFSYGIDVLAQRMSQISGVGFVDVSGAERSAVRVQVDPAFLASIGLSLENVRSFLEKTNANLPKGSLDGPDLSYAIHLNDQLVRAADYRPLVAFQSKGTALRLSDLGNVIDGTVNTRRVGWFDGRPAVLLEVYKQPSANVIETADLVRALLPQIRRWMPGAIKLDVVNDRTGTIRASVNHIEATLLISTALVVLVVFLFLRHFWVTFIPSFSVPLALAGTFAAMNLMGYTLDNLSLMALAVAVGFVVDDAIVVIENIFRHLEAGETPFEAALNGARQIGFTVFSISLSLVAVFIPLIFMTGIVGRLLHEFAVTLTAAIVVSGIVSLTFTPMMCSRFVRHEASETEPNRFLRALESGFAAIQGLYGRALRWVLRRQRFMLGVTFATMVASVVLYILIPKGFFPTVDTGNLKCVVEAGQDTSFQSLAQKVQAATKIILSDPAVYSTAGSVTGGSNDADFFVSLKPLSERKVDAQAVIARLRKRLAGLEGTGVYMQAAQDLRIGGRSSKSALQYTLQSPDLNELRRWTTALERELKAIPHFRDVTDDLESSGLQANVVIDRDAAARLGVAPNVIDQTLYDAFGQRQVSTIYGPLSQYHVVLEAKVGDQLDPHSLERIYVKSKTGQMVPLAALAHVERSSTLLAVSHQGQFPASTISFNLDPGYALGEATAAIDQAAARLHMPSSIHAGFEGAAKAFQQSMASEPLLIGASLLAVYIILGMLYENMIHPLTILSTLPSAGVGALLALRVTGNDLSIVALIGIILLIGLVLKNAIMMIDFALDAERREGLSPEESIYKACLVRFRPITMTTMAALFGALPLALEAGVGAELHRPLGISIVGGLAVSQLLTVFTTPVVYLALGRMRRRVSGTKRATAGASTGTAKALA